MKKIIILLLCTLFMLTGLVAKAKPAPVNSKPAWVDDPKSEYNDGLYLSAVGEGSSRKDAESAAIGNLARIFESKVKAENQYTERYKELSQANQTTSESSTESNKSVSVSAEQTLMNIQIGPAWTDNLGRVYTIAYIHRLNTAEIYHKKIEENAQNVQYYLQMRDQADNMMITYAALSAALMFAEANQVLVDQLAIISPDEREMLQLKYDIQKIRAEAAEVASKMHFSVIVRDDDKDRIKTQFTSLLTGMGFSLDESEAIHVVATVNFEPIDIKQNQKFMRYIFSIEVTDPDGNVLFTMNDTGREGQLTADEAKARCIRTIASKIQKDFRNRLLSYFDGLMQKK